MKSPKTRIKKNKRWPGGKQELDPVHRTQRMLLNQFAEQDSALSQDNSKNPLQKCLVRQGNLFREIHDLMSFQAIRNGRETELDDLDSGVEQGLLNSLRELVFVAHESTSRLAKWADKFPEYIKLVAGEYPSWPLLCDSSRKLTEQQRSLLKAIALDGCRPLIASAAKLHGHSSGARTWALTLLQQIDGSRNFALRHGRPRTHGVWRIIGGDGIPMIPTAYADLVEEAAKLPDLSQTTIREWWRVAKKLLLRITDNKPWERHELSSYANTTKVKAQKKADGAKRADVLKVVEQAFKRLASSACRDTRSLRNEKK